MVIGGGVVYEYYFDSNCGLISFLVVSRVARGQGLSRELVELKCRKVCGAWGGRWRVRGMLQYEGDRIHTYLDPLIIHTCAEIIQGVILSLLTMCKPLLSYCCCVCACLYSASFHSEPSYQKMKFEIPLFEILAALLRKCSYLSCTT